jgi:LPXTG-motif cell wall-anchored protein
VAAYAALWAVGLVLVVLGFVLEDVPWLTFVGFAIGAVGFFLFVRRSQGSVAPGKVERGG